MQRNSGNSNDLERLLVAANEAEKAGVFARTPIDTAALLADHGRQTNPTRRIGRWSHAGRLLTPIAACLCLWVGVNETGVWTSNIAGPVADSVISNTNAVLVSGDENCYDITIFDDCRTGPTGLVSGDCSCVDFDSDGDVDFADFGQFQRLATSRRG